MFGFCCHPSRERCSGNFPFKIRCALKSRAYSCNTILFPEQMRFPTIQKSPECWQPRGERERERERKDVRMWQVFRNRVLVIWSLTHHSTHRGASEWKSPPFSPVKPGNYTAQNKASIQQTFNLGLIQALLLWKASPSERINTWKKFKYHSFSLLLALALSLIYIYIYITLCIILLYIIILWGQNLNHSLIFDPTLANLHYLRQLEYRYIIFSIIPKNASCNSFLAIPSLN